MTAANSEFEQFFRYTSGGWLWDEEQQLQDRYRAFNVAGLQDLAAKAIGSGSCVSITKLAEGGFNKVFRLDMDNGKLVLARIPNLNAGPSFHTTASEVATMEFVSQAFNNDAQEAAADLLSRLEISSIFLYPECWVGTPQLIIRLARNIS